MRGLYSPQNHYLDSLTRRTLSHQTWYNIMHKPRVTIPYSPCWHTSPESQDGERSVGLVAGVAAQPTAPEVMMPQVPKGRFSLEVLQEHNRGQSGQRSHNSFLTPHLSPHQDLFFKFLIPLFSISPTSPGPSRHHYSPRIQPGLLVSPLCPLICSPHRFVPNANWVTPPYPA